MRCILDTFATIQHHSVCCHPNESDDLSIYLMPAYVELTATIFQRQCIPNARTVTYGQKCYFWPNTRSYSIFKGTREKQVTNTRTHKYTHMEHIQIAMLIPGGMVHIVNRSRLVRAKYERKKNEYMNACSKPQPLQFTQSDGIAFCRIGFWIALINFTEAVLTKYVPLLFNSTMNTHRKWAGMHLVWFSRASSFFCTASVPLFRQFKVADSSNYDSHFYRILLIELSNLLFKWRMRHLIWVNRSEIKCRNFTGSRSNTNQNKDTN